MRNELAQTAPDRDGDTTFGPLESFSRCFAATYNYNNPFDFMTEFDDWFEWSRRVYFDRESTGRVTVDMVQDPGRLEAARRPFDFKVISDYLPRINSSFITG